MSNGRLLYAAPVVDGTRLKLSERCKALSKRGVTPYMKVILVGNHGPSLIYTRNKKKFCESIGAKCDIIQLAENTPEADFRSTLQTIVDDANVHGAFVQLPLPPHLQHINVGELIPPHKDVDGFHRENLGRLIQGDSGAKTLIPCTPKGVVTLMNHYGIEISGKNIVVIGRSLIVGRPTAILLTNHDATVTLCHSKTRDLASITRSADIIVSAVGKAKYLDATYIGTNRPIILDVGINTDSEGKLCGDVNQESLIDKVEALSPVPKGIGPMTILSLAQNLVQAAEAQS